MSESLHPRIRKDILLGLKFGVFIIGVALLLTLARRQGWIDAGLLVRAYNVIFGLALAAYCSVIPKMYGPPPRSLRHATLAQATRRVSSWAMTLAFLVWAVLWAFAPQELATIVSMVGVGASVAVSLGYAVWKSGEFRRSKSG